MLRCIFYRLLIKRNKNFDICRWAPSIVPHFEEPLLKYFRRRVESPWWFNSAMAIKSQVWLNQYGNDLEGFEARTSWFKTDPLPLSHQASSACLNVSLSVKINFVVSVCLIVYLCICPFVYLSVCVFVN